MSHHHHVTTRAVLTSSELRGNDCPALTRTQARNGTHKHGDNDEAGQVNKKQTQGARAAVEEMDGTELRSEERQRPTTAGSYNENETES